MSNFAYTYSEDLFHFMFPQFEQQVVFGTGKGGLEKWGSKKFTADFYDQENKTIYEIDGKSHNSFYRQVSDRLRDAFFKEELGIKTIRLSNGKVSDLYWEEMKKANESSSKQFGEAFRLLVSE